MFSLPQAPEEQVRQYLERRGVAEARRGEIANAAQGNWLVVRVLADMLAERPDAEIREAGQLALEDAYEELLSRCGGHQRRDTQRILAVLAAAGAGPSAAFVVAVCGEQSAWAGPGSVGGRSRPAGEAPRSRGAKRRRHGAGTRPDYSTRP